MTKKISLDEWLFALGIYPTLNVVEKFSLFLEMVKECSGDSDILETSNYEIELNTKNIKRLSHKKKASFAAFLENTDLKNEFKKYKKKNISWTHILSSDYPKNLRHIYIPPVVLFYKGDLEIIHNKTWLGVVGARANSTYGIRVLEEIIPPLLKKNRNEIGIVSGLAKGIDRKAHIETMNNKGSTIGVIGTGLDVYYPYNNQSLQKKMGEEHLVLSEYPLTSKPLRSHFPERNRIIAGLSRGVLVVEAKKRSGSLITAYNALDENRDVFAVPGSIFEKNQEGCHKLIDLGAVLVQNHEDILKEWFLI